MTKKVKVPPLSVFVGHCYVQHAGNQRRESHCGRYHTALTAENNELPYVTAFAYGDSIHAGSRDDALSAMKVEDSREADVDVQVSENGSSWNNDEKNSELWDFNFETESIPEDK